MRFEIFNIIFFLIIICNLQRTTLTSLKFVFCWYSHILCFLFSMEYCSTHKIINPHRNWNLNFYVKISLISFEMLLFRKLSEISRNLIYFRRIQIKFKGKLKFRKFIRLQKECNWKCLYYTKIHDRYFEMLYKIDFYCMKSSEWINN